jgi:WD40 repeat protein
MLTACGERAANKQWEHSELGSYAAAFSPDGKYVLVGDTDLPAKLWDIESNKVLYAWQNLPEESGTTTAVAFSGDGKVVATSEQDTIVLWEMATGEPMLRLDFPVKIKALALSEKGHFLMLALYDRTAIYFDVLNNRVLKIFEHDGKPVNSPINQLINAVAISPDGRYAVTGGDDQAARLWDLETGKIKRAWKHGNSVSIVKFLPDGKSVATGAGNDHTHVWDLKTGKRKYTLRSSMWPSDQPLPDFPVFQTTISAIDFSKDGKLIVTGHPSQRICLWNQKTGKNLECWQVSRRHSLRPGVVLQDVAFSPDGKYVYSESGNGLGQKWKIK